MDLDELAEMAEEFTGSGVESRADQLEITRGYSEQAFEKIEPSVTKEIHEFYDEMMDGPDGADAEDGIEAVDTL